MWDKFIAFFAKRHILANLLFIGIMLGGVYFWFATNKEELPNITRDRVSISVSYPGASAEQVEYFVTREIEDKLKGIDGIYRVTSNSGPGTASLSVELELKRPDRDEIITEIRAAAADARLPDEVTDDPRVREFKSSKKAIIDIGLFDDQHRLLTDETRAQLHRYVLTLESQLMNLPQISEVNRSAYRQPEISIESDPAKLTEFNLSLSDVAAEIKAQNARQPAGQLEDRRESKVTLDAELDTVQELQDVIIQSGFSGRQVQVRDFAGVRETFEKTKFIQKINGREGVFLSAVKTAEADILESVDAVKALVERFQATVLKDTGYQIALLDDESRELRNRLDIILYNGVIGLVLVLIILLLFLNFHTALWVAMGIPFTFAFTMVGINMLGYTINNITLGAIIIVMGMIVDDAIIVAENISRYRAEGMAADIAAIKGTSYVLLPITAAIITTCLSFTPLFMNIGGWHGVMISFLPPVIFLMLAGSWFESVLILPSHMTIRMPNWMLGQSKQKNEDRVRHWFLAWENKYEKILNRALKYKYWVFLLALVIIGGTLFAASTMMKFTMFPRTESDQINLMGKAPRGTLAQQTAMMIEPVEDMLMAYMGKEMIGFRTEIARSRRGRAVEENRFRIRIQIVPRQERAKSLNQLEAEWEKKLDPFRANFEELRFSRSWWGGSESPIQILVKDNNDGNRKKCATALAEKMRSLPALENVEVDRPLTNPEYKIDLNRPVMKRLGISAAAVRSTLRAAVEGMLLYEIKGENEEYYVRLTIPKNQQKKIEDILNVPVENQGNYLVPLRSIATIQKQETPANIERQDYIRTLMVFADIKAGSKQTPLEMAGILEQKILPELQRQFPTTGIQFTGEIFDSRQTQQDMLMAVIMALALIFAVLALLFNSPYKPLLIMVTIPFGVVGVIWCLILHGMSVYGFFSLIGALGMMGVVINDSIVMLTKLDREYDRCGHKEMSDSQIATIAKTRLQAVLLTTLTTIAALFPTAYGWAGFDSMLSEMMLVMGWGLIFGTIITLLLVPCLYGFTRDLKHWVDGLHPKSQAQKGCA